LIIRTFLRNRNNESIKNNDNISKFNYGSRKYYSIEDTLLEKQLLYNAS